MSEIAAEKVIPTVMVGVLNSLKSAANEESVKEVFNTSSSVAATLPMPGGEYSIDEGSCGEEAIQKT